MKTKTASQVTTKLTFAALVLGFSLQIGAETPSYAKDRDHQTLRYSQSASESHHGSKKFGVGFSTIQNALPVAGNGAVTATIDLSSLDTLQVFLNLPYTSPFNIGAALFYKRTILDHGASGFHLGGGFGLADYNAGGLSDSALGISVSMIFGFHFEVPSVPHIVVHLDGGPTLSLLNTSPTARNNFGLGPFSTLLGLSVVYVF